MKFLLITTSILLTIVADAQLTRSGNYLKDKGDTTWLKISRQVTRKKVSNGDVRIYSEPGKYDLYASYRNKRVTNYYAIDTKGNKIPVTYAVKDEMTCRACMMRGDQIVCYDVDCKKIPPPVEKATANERPKPEDPDQGGEIFKKSDTKAKQ